MSHREPGDDTLPPSKKPKLDFGDKYVASLLRNADAALHGSDINGPAKKAPHSIDNDLGDSIENHPGTREPFTSDINTDRFEQLALDLKEGGPIIFTKTSQPQNNSKFSKHMYKCIKDYLTDAMEIEIGYNENKVKRAEYGYETPRIYREVLILVIIKAIPIINLALVRTKDDPSEPVAFYLRGLAYRFLKYTKQPHKQQFDLAIETLNSGVSNQERNSNKERKRTVAGFLMGLVHHLARAVVEYSKLSDINIYLEDSWQGYDKEKDQSIYSETFETQEGGIENAKRYTASKEWPDKYAYDMNTSGFYGAWGFKNVPDVEKYRAIELVGGNGAHLRFPWKRAKVYEMRALNASMAHP